MSETEVPDDPRRIRYPHVPGWAFDVVDIYGDHLNSTGGNDPLSLVNDLNNPNNRNFAKVNIVRFTLAAQVWSQLLLLSRLRQKEVLA